MPDPAAGTTPAVHVQMVLFDGFDPLDVVAPFEVLAAGGEAAGGDMTIEFVTAEGAREVIGGTRGLALRATGTLDPQRAGVVVLPGASGPIAGDPDAGDETIPVILARLGDTALIPAMARALENPEVLVATVCGGSLALAMAGLLVGRRVTTNALGLDVLDATGVEVVPARVVDDGDLVTAGGVTSGLDLALYLLDRLYGPRVAHAVEQLFEYERRGVAWADRGRTPVAL